MRKKAAIFLTAVLTMSLLSACGGSGASAGSGAAGGSASADAGKGGNTKSGKGEVTWSWGTLRGLYGDAEVTFNEDGGRETVLMKYPNGKLYRQIEYSYDNSYYGSVDSAGAGESFLSGKKVYPVMKTTKDAGGNTLYSYGYEWAKCENKVEFWGAGIASDITPILESGELVDEGKTPEETEERYYSCYEYGYDNETQESSGYANYQELSHLTLSGQYRRGYYDGSGYWLTKKVDGNPSKTWFYAADGRLDEDITITWKYEKGKPVSLQLGQYSMHTYLAETSDDGRTVTYTLDESHTAEGEAKEGEKAETKDLEQVYAFTLTWQEDGKPAMFRYGSSKEFMNTDSPQTKEYTITYQYENGVLAGGEYQTEEDGKALKQYTITCNEEGMLETEDHLNSGDIGAKAYTYHDNGMVKSMTCYEGFTTEDSTQIKYVKNYSEDGWLCGEALYRNGAVYAERFYFENGEKAGSTTYHDGNLDTTYTYNENGVYTMYERHRDDGSVCQSGEMTGENEFTMYGYKQDETNTQYVLAVYTYEEDGFKKTAYNEDGSVSYEDTYRYHDGKNHQ